LSADAVREMQRLTGRRSATEGNGVAWAIGQSAGRRTISHSGGMPGVATMLRIFPDDNAATVVLTNSDPSPVTGDITERLTRSLFADAPPRESPPSGRGGGASPVPSPAATPTVPLTGTWEGRLVHFEGDVPVQLQISDSATLLVKFGVGPARPLQDAAASGDRVRGRTETRLVTQAGYHGVPTLEFRLRRDGERLIGVAVAQASGYFALSHWVNLKRTAGGPPDPQPAAAGATFDVVLRGGRIVDGCGTPSYLADLAIRDGRIAAIGRLDGAAATRTIDCTGLVVAPGFIDMMGQTASPFLTDPNAGFNLLTQGITTINCGEGGSAAPLGPDDAARAGWRTMAEYFDRLEKAGLPINMVQTVGHTQVRRIVIGDVDRPPTAPELDQMKSLVREAMDAGAIGLSTALIYPPAVYASTDEIVELARAAGEQGGRYFTHMRNEGDRLLEAIDEAIAIGRAAGTPVHIFHLKTAGRQNWPKMDQAIARIRDARAAGMDVAADIYPYINNGLGLRAFIHPRHSAAGAAELLKKLDDPSTRAAIRREMESDRGWENWFQHIGADWDHLVLSGMKLDPYAAHNGKSLGEIARTLGRDPWDVFFAVARADCFALPQSMSEDNKIKAMTQEFISFDTDVGPAMGSGIATHPRAFGAFPRVLARYVRDKKILSLEQAVNRMTAVAANELMLYDRGRLAPGLAADLVVFDFARIQDHATLAEPNIPSTGVRYLFVNGHVVLEDSKYTGIRPGRVLRRPQSKARTP
jgi:N-acyl-D-aspartate/D-glutamate deacylase